MHPAFRRAAPSEPSVMGRGVLIQNKTFFYYKKNKKNCGVGSRGGGRPQGLILGHILIPNSQVLGLRVGVRGIRVQVSVLKLYF